MSTVRHAAGYVWKIAGTAIWNWVSTFLTMAGVGLLCGAATWLWLRGSPPYDVIVAGAAVVECLVAGWMLAGKRGVSSALLHGVEQLGVGRSAMSHLFSQVERVLGGSIGPSQVPDTATATATSMMSSAEATRPSSAPADALLDRKLSVTELESAIKRAATEILGERTAGWAGWGYRLVEGRLLRAVNSLVGQRLREQGSQGTSLRELRSDLENRADSLLTSRFRSLAFRSTILILGVLFALLTIQAALTTWALTRWGAAATTTVGLN